MKNFRHSFLEEVYFFEHLTSSMHKAEEMVKRGEVRGNFAVIAAIQKAGIGRNGHHWYSPKGGLWFTLGIYGFELRPNFTLFCGLQMQKTLAGIINNQKLEIKLKWPNDIYLNDQKAGGMIVKNFARQNYCLVGIGINTNFTDFSEQPELNATSLKKESGEEIDNSQILQIFLDHLEAELPAYLNGYGVDLEEFMKHDLLLGKTITIETEFASYSGICQGISKDGALLIKLKENVIQPFYAGDISW